MLLFLRLGLLENVILQWQLVMECVLIRTNGFNYGQSDNFFTCSVLTYKFFWLCAFIVFPLPRWKIYSQVIFLSIGWWLVCIPILILPRSAIRPLPHSSLIIVISANPWRCSYLEKWHNELVSFLIWNRCEVSVLSCFLTCAPCFIPFLCFIFE